MDASNFLWKTKKISNNKLEQMTNVIKVCASLYKLILRKKISDKCEV